MAPRFNWGMGHIEDFFNLLCRSYNDYLIAKELRRMDEFYEMIGNAIGADGLVVQNFLKKTGRAYRDILLQAETCAEEETGPERKLRGSARVYDLYEQYYQMYYLGYVPHLGTQNETVTIQRKQASDLVGRKRKNFTVLGDPALTTAYKRRALNPIDFDNDEKVAISVDSSESTDHGELEDLNDSTAEQSPQETVHFTTLKEEEMLVREQASVKINLENNRRKPAVNKPENLPNGSTTSDSTPQKEAPPQDTVFGKPTDFQERFLKLMENQNRILTNIVDELNLIRHAVLDANGLQTITYVK